MEPCPEGTHGAASPGLAAQAARRPGARTVLGLLMVLGVALLPAAAAGYEVRWDGGDPIRWPLSQASIVRSLVPMTRHACSIRDGTARRGAYNNAKQEWNAAIGALEVFRYSRYRTSHCGGIEPEDGVNDVVVVRSTASLPHPA